MKWKLYKESSNNINMKSLIDLVDMDKFDAAAAEVARKFLDKVDSIYELRDTNKETLDKVLNDDDFISKSIENSIKSAEQALSELKFNIIERYWTRKMVRGGKKVLLSDLVQELDDRGSVNPKIKDSDLDMLKSWINQLVQNTDNYYMPLNAVRRAMRTGLINKVKQVTDDEYSKMYSVDNVVEKVMNADDKVAEIVSIRKSLPKDMDSKFKNELLDAAYQTVVDDLLKNSSLEELGKEWVHSYGYVNGWGYETSVKYRIAAKIHGMMVKKNPNGHKDNSWSTMRGNHWDGCTCGFGYNTDSSD